MWEKEPGEITQVNYKKEEKKEDNIYLKTTIKSL